MAFRDSRGAKSQEINVRTVMAFREIGQCDEAMKTFASILNMLPPITLKSYNKINSNLLPFYEAASCDCMKNAVTGVRKNVCPTTNWDLWFMPEAWSFVTKWCMHCCC